MTELSATVILNNYTGYDWRLSSYHTGKLITLVNAETDATPLPKALKKTERLVIQAQVNASFLDEQSNEVIRTSIQYNILNELKPNTVMALDISTLPLIVVSNAKSAFFSDQTRTINFWAAQE